MAVTCEGPRGGVMYILAQVQAPKVKDDGGWWGPSLHTFGSLPNGPIQVKESKMIKEIQAMVRNYLDNPDSGLVHSSRKWPGFVYLLEQNPEG